MDATSKAEVMKRYVEAFKRKDWEAATAFWADDIVLHAQGRHPLAGDFFGKQAFLDHWSSLSPTGRHHRVGRGLRRNFQRRARGCLGQGAGGAWGAESSVRPG